MVVESYLEHINIFTKPRLRTFAVCVTGQENQLLEVKYRLQPGSDLENFPASFGRARSGGSFFDVK